MAFSAKTAPPAPGSPPSTSISSSTLSLDEQIRVFLLLEGSFDFSPTNTNHALIPCEVKWAEVTHISLQDEPFLTDRSLLFVSRMCPDLQTLSLNRCTEVTDKGLILIVNGCTGLKSLSINDCHQVTDKTIQTITERVLSHKLMLEELMIQLVPHITIDSLIQLSAASPFLRYLQTSIHPQVVERELRKLGWWYPQSPYFDTSGILLRNEKISVEWAEAWRNLLNTQVTHRSALLQSPTTKPGPTQTIS